MFNALPLSKTPAAPLLAPVNPPLPGIASAGPATQLNDEFARAMDRAQSLRRSASLQPPSPPTQRPTAPAPAARAPAPERTDRTERTTRQAPQNAASPPHGSTTPARAQQQKAAARSSDNANAANSSHGTNSASAASKRDATNPMSTESATAAMRRTTRARNPADEGQADTAAATASAAVAPSSPQPDKAAAAAQGSAGATGSEMTLAVRATPNDGASSAGPAPGSQRHAAGVGGAAATLSDAGLHCAVCPEHAPALNPGAGADPAGRRSHGTTGPSGHAGRAGIGIATGTDADLVGNTNVGAAAKSRTSAGDKIGPMNDELEGALNSPTDGPRDDDKVGAAPGEALFDMRITAPVCDYKIAPHLVDSLGASATASATAPAAALATGAGTPAPSTSDLATAPGTGGTMTLTATAAGGWRFAQERQPPDVNHATRPAALTALASAIGAANGLAPEQRSREAFSPFFPAPKDATRSASTTGANMAEGGAAGADSAPLNGLAALLGSAEGGHTGMTSAGAASASTPGAQAMLASTAGDWQRSAIAQGIRTRHDSDAGDTSVRGPGRSAESAAPVFAQQPGMAAETGASGLPSFATSLAAQVPGGTVETSLTARPASAGFAAEFGQKITLLVLDGVQTAKLHLNPAEMGPVTVQIQLDGATAQVHLAAENGDTRQALQDSMPQLASQLRESGLTLTGGGVFEQPRQTPQEPSQDPQTGQQDAKERGRDAADDNRQALHQRSGGAGGTATRRGLVDLVA